MKLPECSHANVAEFVQNFFLSITIALVLSVFATRQSPAAYYLWAAAQDVGVRQAFFSRDGTNIDATDIRIGENLVANRAINLRARAADFSHVVKILLENHHVLIAEIKKFDTPVGSQIWVRLEEVNHDRSTRAEVANCLRDGYQTTRDLYVCSRRFFTPTLLSACLLGGSCDFAVPGFAFKEVIEVQGGGWSQPVVPANVTIDGKQLAQCAVKSDQNAYEACIASQVVPPPPPVQDCGGLTLDPDELGRCLIARLPSPWNSIADCLMGQSRNNPAGCFQLFSPQLADQLRDVQACVTRSGDQVTAETIGCLLGTLPAPYGRLSTCLTRRFDNATEAIGCVAAVPSLQPAAQFFLCIQQNLSDTGQLLNCVTPLGITVSPAIRQCLQQTPNSPDACLANRPEPEATCVRSYRSSIPALMTCLVGNRPEIATPVRLVECFVNGGEIADFVAACLPIDERIKTVVSCALKQTETRALLGCAATTFLNDDQRRMLSCAMASDSYFEFAVCAVGLKLNREWAVAIKCAGASGGDPLVAGACTAGKLTMDEIQKCKRGIGSDNGCFGPNNTIIQTLNIQATAISNGPGLARQIVAAGVVALESTSTATVAAAQAFGNSVAACATNLASCSADVQNFCQENRVICATGGIVPWPGNPQLPPIPPLPPITFPQTPPLQFPNVPLPNVPLPDISFHL